jgi:hypothetical protein
MKQYIQHEDSVHMYKIRAKGAEQKESVTINK